jgi:hypothetical protein
VSEYAAEKNGRPIWTFFSHFISSAQRQPNGWLNLGLTQFEL